MKYRNINKLVDVIKKQVPKAWGDYEGFTKALDGVKESAAYRAPEAYVVNFEQLAGVLGSWIGDPVDRWQKRVADIFNGKREVKEMTYVEI